MNLNAMIDYLLNRENVETQIEKINRLKKEKKEYAFMICEMQAKIADMEEIYTEISEELETELTMESEPEQEQEQEQEQEKINPKITKIFDILEELSINIQENYGRNPSKNFYNQIVYGTSSTPINSVRQGYFGWFFCKCRNVKIGKENKVPISNLIGDSFYKGFDLELKESIEKAHKKIKILLKRLYLEGLETIDDCDSELNIFQSEFGRKLRFPDNVLSDNEFGNNNFMVSEFINTGIVEYGIFTTYKLSNKKILAKNPDFTNFNSLINHEFDLLKLKI